MASAATFLSLFLLFLSSSIPISHQQPPLNSAEQDSLYQVLSSINSDIPWRTLYPDDLCLSAPHGVVCDYFIDQQQPNSSNISDSDLIIAHITELSFGYVSDYTPNAPCSSNSTLHPLLFTSFKYLRKLFFYKCFNETSVSFSNFSSSSFADSVEELVFVENPALVVPLSGIIGNFTNLRRLILTGNGVYGNIPIQIGDLLSLEEITLSRNRLTGGIPVSVAKLKNLKVVDLSQNLFDGNLPDSLGNLNKILKLDLSHNGFSGRIPESLINLNSLEFLDLSFNRFGNFGIPSFLGEISSLKEVYMSGNLLGGHIPEKWGKLGGISAIGFSNMGLIGKIPSSMGVYLRNLSYLRLDNNSLEGEVPKELGFLELANEINLENNNLSGKIPFTVRVGQKLKVKGNSKLCKDHGKNEGNMDSPVLFKEGNLVSSISPVEALWSFSLYGFMMMLGFFAFVV
ncbi:piriformospora indica-insensitive protein 2 [Euphorbia lathyris]|uniref:piriformospora indica-insensitive protein 2 n=1 Tax=Euphorbia lathyris TaxID=212925 RepID=UPI00331309CA